MKSEWKIVKFDELISILTDYHANGSYKVLKDNVELLDKPDYAIMIRTTNFENESFNDNMKYITENAYEYLKKTKVFPGDIIMNKIANPGTSYYMPDLQRPVSLAMNLFLIRVNTAKAIPRFIYYYLRSNESYVKSFALGSVTQTITKQAVRNLDINLPPLDIQNKITHIIGTIEDKMELNRKMNQTLEEMAQALFKSWFVDFDPVHAKANCSSDEELETAAKELGISKEILELFPSEFEESELGMIPKGWEVKKFGDIVTPKKGKNITKATIVEGSVPVVAGGLSPAYYHNQHNVESPVITISASGANAGYVNLYNVNIWASDCSYINNTNSTYVFTNYVYLKLNQSKITWMQQGAAQPHIYPSHIMRLDIVDAGNELWDFFENTLSPMFKKIGTNELEIQTLQKTRDTLLPKLLSGELDVSELELDMKGN